jgi:iron complex transport system substrate-binding protein
MKRILRNWPSTNATNGSFSIGFFVVLSIALLAACERSAVESKAPAANPPAEDSSKIRLVDRLDREVRFSKIPTRIVSLSPSTTELLFALGLGSSVVGRTEHCNYPLEALDIAKVGSGTLEGISREAIVSLQPDLVLCKWDSHQPLIETFEKLAIPIVAFGPENIQDMFKEARLIGSITGHQTQAEQLVDRMSARLERLKAVVSKISVQDRKRVFYQVWDAPLMTAGPTSFIGELLTTAGFNNVFSDMTNRYTRVSSEVLVERDPQIIFAPTTHSTEVKLESFATRSGWENVTAVREGKIYIINGDQVSRCGPRLLDAMEQMIRLGYPDIVAGLDP